MSLLTDISTIATPFGISTKSDGDYIQLYYSYQSKVSELTASNFKECCTAIQTHLLCLPNVPEAAKETTMRTITLEIRDDGSMYDKFGAYVAVHNDTLMSVDATETYRETLAGIIKLVELGFSAEDIVNLKTSGVFNNSEK